MLTKTEECILLDDTIVKLPPGYLRDILVSEHDAIVTAIQNDVTFLGLARAVDEAIQAHKRIAEAEKCLAKIRAEMETYETGRQTAELRIRRLISDLTELL